MAATQTWTSRAVERPIEAGNSAACALCGTTVKFIARQQGRQIIANVYEGGRWIRVEHFHALCYADAGQPYGPAAA